MIKEIIYAEMEKRKADWQKKSHWPSEVSACKRQLWYKWRGVEKSNPITAPGWVKMELGHATHDRIFKWLKDSGIQIINEISGEKVLGWLKYPIHYRIDNVIEKDGRDYILEIKSKYAQGMRSVEERPNESDVKQLQLYLDMADIDNGILLYIGRDNGFMVEWEVGRAENITTLYEKYREIERLIEVDVEPAREFRAVLKEGVVKDKVQKDKVVYKSDWQCSYCPYLNYCYRQEIENKKTILNA